MNPLSSPGTAPLQPPVKINRPNPSQPVMPQPVMPQPRSGPLAPVSPAPEAPELDSGPLEQVLQQKSPRQLQHNSLKVPQPSGLQSQNPYCGLATDQLIETLMQGRKPEGGACFGGILRKSAELGDSGILRGFQELSRRNVAVPASEYHRSIRDDAVLVMQGFARLNPDQIHALKEKAYTHPEVAPEKQAAIERGFYGSEKHKQFGALVETLTGGVLSAEEAMAMYPCGGIPGPGAHEVPLISSFASVQRHAMRHDALGFLLTRFGVGPGYGSKTTILGRQSDDPLAGQILGIAREALREASVFPASHHIGRPERFQT